MFVCVRLKALFLLRFVFFLALITETVVLAQNQGEIRLEVNDPSGAALQASGHLRGTNLDSSFQTDAQGTFDFKGLAFGNYRLEVSRPGPCGHGERHRCGAGVRSSETLSPRHVDERQRLFPHADRAGRRDSRPDSSSGARFDR